MYPSPAQLTLMEKVAVDNGFDRALESSPEWLGFASTRVPLRIWFTCVAEGFLVTFSQPNVAQALVDHGTPVATLPSPLPDGAVAGRTVAHVRDMHDLVRRAFQLSRSLPNELLHVFQRETADLPRATEAEQLVIRRVGQDVFRAGLLDYWEGRCAVTGLAVAELLRASHIKPWADCAADAERLDVFNGLLLAPHLDAAFDRGFITFADDGLVVVSPQLDQEASRLLGLDRELRARLLDDGHRRYLPWHRDRVFRASSIPPVG